MRARGKYHPPLHCQEGCFYCCCKPGVLTSIPELLRILDYIHTAFDAAAMSELNNRARRYVRQLAGRNSNAPTNESVPCPFLVDGRCSIYDVRPLTCRGYNSMNVDACRNAHENQDVLIPMFSVLKDVTDGITVGMVQELKAAGFTDSLVDLGSAVKMGLDIGDRFSENVISGRASLSSVENSSFIRDLWGKVCGTALQLGIDVSVFDKV